MYVLFFLVTVAAATIRVIPQDQDRDHRIQDQDHRTQDPDQDNAIRNQDRDR